MVFCKRPCIKVPPTNIQGPFRFSHGFRKRPRWIQPWPSQTKVANGLYSSCWRHVHAFLCVFDYGSCSTWCSKRGKTCCCLEPQIYNAISPGMLSVEESKIRSFTCQKSTCFLLLLSLFSSLLLDKICEHSSTWAFPHGRLLHLTIRLGFLICVRDPYLMWDSPVSL